MKFFLKPFFQSGGLHCRIAASLGAAFQYVSNATAKDAGELGVRVLRITTKRYGKHLTMDMHADVIIIGAGILGLSVARRLAEHGCSSVILEREEAAGLHASGKNAGMFRQLYRDQQLRSWAQRSPALWPERIRTHCFRQTGSYVLGRTVPKDCEKLFEPRRVITPAGDEIDAVFCATDGLIDPPAFLEAFAGELPQKMARVAFDTRALSIRWESESWKVETEASTVESDFLIIANGAWAAEIPIASPIGDLRLSHSLLQPFARYLFVLDGFPENYMPESDCGFYWNEADEWYIRRWENNTRLFSLCEQVASNPDSFLSIEMPNEILAEALASAFPKHSSGLRSVRSWHCFRTYAPDQLPIWGPDPRQDRLFWLAGFGGFGMSTGVAAGSDLADLIAEGRTSVSSDVLVVRLLND